MANLPYVLEANHISADKKKRKNYFRTARMRTFRLYISRDKTRYSNQSRDVIRVWSEKPIDHTYQIDEHHWFGDVKKIWSIDWLGKRNCYGYRMAMENNLAKAFGIYLKPGECKKFKVNIDICEVKEK